MLISTVDDRQLTEILTRSHVIAVVGHSNRPQRTSYQIAQFLRQTGYRVYPVNSAVAEIDGHRTYATLADIPEPVDIVNIFRRSEFLPTIVDEAIAIHAKMIWAQLGIFHNTAAQRAIAAGLDVVMDACIKVDYSRLRVQRQ